MMCVLDVGAVEPYTMQPAEIARMPDYCQAKMSGGTAAEQKAWADRFGALWIDMHHYCHGLKFVLRASRAAMSDLDRSYNLTASLGEFDYILRSKNAAGGHWFLPDVHMQKASVYRRLGRYKEASAETQKALAASRK